MILAIGGNFNPESTLNFIEASFGKVPPKASPERPSYNRETPFISRSQTHHAKTQLYRVNLRFPTVKLNHKDLYALDLLEYILTEGNTALLPKN